HAILVRHDRIGPETGGGEAIGRFAREAPNPLWQMDFQGRTQLVSGPMRSWRTRMAWTVEADGGSVPRSCSRRAILRAPQA
ncbi:hypothetical protein ACC674_38795, partial [Rhizobium ruizarguesonis]